MAALGPREGVEARLRHVFGLPLGDVDAAIAAGCGDELFDLAALRRIGLLNAPGERRVGSSGLPCASNGQPRRLPSGRGC